MYKGSSFSNNNGGEQRPENNDIIPSFLFQGKLSVAVPGELLAMYNAWKIQGRLPWRRLFEPTINLAKNGFKIDEPLAIAIKFTMKKIIKENGFK